MAYQRPTLTALINQAISNINALIAGADARLRYSVLNVFANTWAAMVDGLYSALGYAFRQMHVQTAEGEYLDLLGDAEGVLRLQPTAASGCVLAYGAGANILTGTVFNSPAGLQYQTTASVTIPVTGFAEVAATCLTLGAEGNLSNGVQLTPTSPVALLTSAEVCAAGIGGGADVETDDQYRERILFRKRNPRGAGTATDWVDWAEGFNANVNRVSVIPTINGNGTVGVSFMLNNNAPNGSEVAAMDNYLAGFTPIGSTLVVIAPTLVPVNFTIQVTPNTPDIKSSVIAQLEDLLYREALAGNTIPLSRINEAISGAVNEYDHTLVLPSAPLVFAANSNSVEIGILGTITWL
jgi:uncharacterized phage protein gp47/JayE